MPDPVPPRATLGAPVNRLDRLSPREREILGQVARGRSTNGIAADLFLSPHTVRTHLKNVLRKLETSSRAHAAALLMAERPAVSSEARDLAVRALMLAVDARDPYSSSHSRAVVTLAGHVAGELGLAESDRRDIADIARLHDIGKLGVPEGILWKAAALDRAEWAIMRRHPEIAQGIVAAIEPLAHLATAIRAAHERWDGAGYPDGLRGEAIPLASRIVFVCHAYDAMITDRSYRPALSPAQARAALRQNAGSQFCPSSTRALLRILG